MIAPAEPVGISSTNIFYAVAAFHALMLTIFLWTKRSKLEREKVSNRLFGSLMFVFSIMLLEHTMDLGGYFFRFPALIEVVTPAFFLMGPFMYSYVRHQTDVGYVYSFGSLVKHSTPALAQALITLPFYLNSNSAAKILYFYEDRFPKITAGSGDVAENCSNYLFPWDWESCSLTIVLAPEYPQFNLTLATPFAFIWESNIPIYALFISLGGYTALSFRYLRRHARQLKSFASNTQSKDLRWVSCFLYMIGSAVCIYIVLTLQGLYSETSWLSLDQRNHFIYALLAISVVYVGHMALHQPVIFSSEFEAPTQAEVKSKIKPEKYKNSALSKDLSKQVAEQIMSALIEKELYLDAQLTLLKLSESVGFNSQTCSQAINESLNCNFFDLVNDCRLARAKKLLLEHSKRPVLDIAMDSGFNSKTSFYSFFKKREGVSPSSWRKRELQNLATPVN